MNTGSNRVDALDVSMFDAIPSQTGPGDRRSLLAVQRAVARKHGEYAYLEIGSHLGGSLQPHLADDRCKRIYSIDPRPLEMSDDRVGGFIPCYPENSTRRMLDLLRGTGSGNVAKIECFDLDASQVEVKKITSRPRIAFIDGVHTKAAAISDFRFCSKVISNDGVILFHDFYIIHPALREIFTDLGRQLRSYLPVKLEDGVFAIFLDRELPTSDPYLAPLLARHKYFWFAFQLRTWLKNSLPGPMLRLLRYTRSMFR